MWRGQCAVEVGDGFPLPVQPPGFDLMNQDVAAPAMLNGRFGVPDAVLGSLDQIEDADVMAPRNLCNKLLHNCFIRPGLTERTHVFQISRGESSHSGEVPLEVRRQTVDHFRSPVFPLLPVENIAADLPVEQDQLPVDRQRRAKLRRANPPVQVGEKLSVTIGNECFRHGSR